MKTLNSIFGITAIAFVFLSSAVVNAQSLDSIFSAEIREDEIREFGGEVNTAFVNVQGDDDEFTVYSLVDFDSSSIGQVTGITSLSLDLAQATAGFSMPGDLEFFLATDTRVVDLTDTARYVSDFATGGSNPNTGADVVGSAFGTLYSLGTGTYAVTTTGDVDNYVLTLDAAGEAFAVSQINSGGLLRIIVTPADAAVQATYAGPGIFFDPPPAIPVLNVTATTGGGGTLKGDVNLDGNVTFLDINPFISLLTTNGYSAEADCDCDGDLDFLDIQPFIDFLSGN